MDWCFVLIEEDVMVVLQKFCLDNFYAQSEFQKQYFWQFDCNIIKNLVFCVSSRLTTIQFRRKNLYLPVQANSKFKNELIAVCSRMNTYFVRYILGFLSRLLHDRRGERHRIARDEQSSLKKGTQRNPSCSFYTRGYQCVPFRLFL